MVVVKSYRFGGGGGGDFHDFRGVDNVVVVVVVVVDDGGDVGAMIEVVRIMVVFQRDCCHDVLLLL